MLPWFVPTSALLQKESIVLGGGVEGGMGRYLYYNIYTSYKVQFCENPLLNTTAI